jgi:hypothetical protein
MFLRGPSAGGDGVVTILAQTNLEGRASLEVVLVQQDGRQRSVASLDRCFGGTARFSALQQSLYLICVDESEVFQDLYSLSLVDGALRPVTNNSIHGLSLSGFDLTAAGGIVYALHESRSNIWLIESER